MPNTASSLHDAMEALREGDTEKAQRALGDAWVAFQQFERRTNEVIQAAEAAADEREAERELHQLFAERHKRDPYFAALFKLWTQAWAMGYEASNIDDRSGRGRRDDDSMHALMGYARREYFRFQMANERAYLESLAALMRVAPPLDVASMLARR